MVDSTMDNNIVSVVVFYNLGFTVIKFTVIKIRILWEYSRGLRCIGYNHNEKSMKCSADISDVSNTYDCIAMYLIHTEILHRIHCM